MTHNKSTKIDANYYKAWDNVWRLTTDALRSKIRNANLAIDVQVRFNINHHVISYMEEIIKSYKT